jgi:hypothetical protein
MSVFKNDIEEIILISTRDIVLIYEYKNIIFMVKTDINI